MTASTLENYLHEHIPLSRVMAVAVVSVAEHEVVLQAPLEPNINHRETVFGGSASAIATLAAWSLLHTRLHAEDISCRLVIQRNSMSYDKPISGDFKARSFLVPDSWQTFTQMLARKGKARITVSAVLSYAGDTAGRFTGDFVALR